MKEQFQLSIEKLIDKLNGWLDSIIISLPNLILATMLVFLAMASL